MKTNSHMVVVGAKVPLWVKKKIAADAKRLITTPSRVMAHILTQHYKRKRPTPRAI